MLLLFANINDYCRFPLLAVVLMTSSCSSYSLPGTRSRSLLGAIPFPGGKTAMGTFAVNTASSWTVEGTVEFTQNIFSGSSSRYTAHIKGNNMESKNYAIGLADDCTGTSYKVISTYNTLFLSQFCYDNVS